jgi:hypothetical protein
MYPRPDGFEFDLNGFEVSIKFYVFDVHIAFLKKQIICCHIITFTNFEGKRGQNGCKKTEFFFYKCVLELYFATINGLGEPSC